MLSQVVDTGERKRITGKMLVMYDRWYELKKDPMILYRKGQLLLSLNEKKEAGKHFLKASTAFPEQSPHRSYSEKLAGKLVKQ